MAKKYFKTLALDLLALEINTIIKSDMTAIKMPSSRRQALYKVASTYHSKLQELEVRKPVIWRFAGMRSFGELRDRAKEGIGKFENELQSATKEEQESLREDIKMLERIQEQCSNIVDMFYKLMNSVEDKNKRQKGYKVDVPNHKLLEESQEEAVSHEESEMWNNDIERSRMNKIEDLNVTVDQVTLIRKAWEIGTERIVLQTVVQIDGDVTTRISERFAKKPNDTILKIHNDSITTSTSFWAQLVKTLGEIAGKAFERIVGR